MSHTTRYGNTYSDEDWAEMQAEFARVEAEEKVITDQIAGMEKYLKRQLTELGLNKSQIVQVVRLFKYGEFEDANIQFSSKERQEKITNLWQRWNTAMSKLEI